MTRDKKIIREPATSEQDVTPIWDRLDIHPEYKEFIQYKKNRDIKTSTLVSWTWKLAGFPTPDNLRGKHFEDRLESKKVSKKTVRFELTLARMFCKWAKREQQLRELQDFDLGKMENGITEDDIYTAEELNAIFQATDCTRDRAMLQVLYESGFRARELLSMTFEGVRPGKGGRLEVKCHESKTKERWVILDMSVPALQEWRESHPFKKGALWVTRRKKSKGGKISGQYEPISYIGFYHIVNKVLRDAGIRESKKRIIHLFRHTRITHLRIRGTKGTDLHQYVGWTLGSNMERVYVHMNQQEVLDQVYKTQGIIEEEPIKKVFEKRICQYCKTENEPTRGYCKSCNRALTPELQALEEKTELEQRMTDLETRERKSSQKLMSLLLAVLDRDEKEMETILYKAREIFQENERTQKLVKEITSTNMTAKNGKKKNPKKDS